MNKDILKRIVFTCLFLIPFVPFLVSGAFFFPFITTKAFAFRILVEVALAAWVILACISKEYRPKKSLILYSLLAFTVVIGLADAFGVAPVKSFWSNYERMEGFISILHLGALFLVAGSVFKEGEWKWWWNTSLAASFLMVLYCFSQLLGISDIHQGGVRVDGTLGNSAYLAVYLLFHIFIAWMFLVREKQNVSLKWIYSLLIVSQVSILYYTATRGAILGLLGGVLLVAILNLRNKESQKARRASVGILIGMVVLLGGFYLIRNTSFVTNSSVLSRFSSISPAELKTEGRSFVWPMAVKGVLEHPLLGWGQDNFNYVFNEHYDPKMYNLEPWFDRAHNIFLDWAIAGGLLGLAGYLALYFALLFSIWKRATGFSTFDKSILTGLLVAYFFHNLFVFDHLASYILFFSLLAYIHTLSTPSSVSESEDQKVRVALPIILVLFCCVIYFVNIQPIIANMNLIKGLDVLQKNTDDSLVLGYFEKAYNESRLGRPETVEWIAGDAQQILTSSISTEAKNAYFAFARDAIAKQVADVPTDARYQMIAGQFFMKTGFPDEALKYLTSAQKLIPGKQVIYFSIGELQINKGDYAGALATFKQAYDLAPEYIDAKIIYFIGALYAGDGNLAQTLSQTIPHDQFVSDDRILGALVNLGRINDAVTIFNERIVKNPNNQQNYISLAATYVKAGRRAEAKATLTRLGQALPDYKAQADDYIKQIDNGTIK